MHDIEVNDLQSHLPGMKRKVTDGLRTVLRRETIQRYHVSVALVDDARIRDLNRRFLGRDEPTDVLSFPCRSPTTTTSRARSS